MSSPAMTWSIVGALCVITSAVAAPCDPSFECPDERSLHLLNVAVLPRSQHGFKDLRDAFAFVIENSAREMDAPALRIACSRLAYELYVNEYLDPGSDAFGLIPPKDAALPLRKRHPILAKCPYHALYETQLPIRIPGPYSPPDDAVRHGVTGWVDLELDVSADGKVESARITDSSNPILEPGVVDYVLKFRYPKSSHYDGQFMRRQGFQVRIITDYFQIARAKGCEWDDPRPRPIIR
jgi:Gram-negative bacterial TonB protein C-terminal